MKTIILSSLALLIGIAPLRAADTYQPLQPGEVSEMPEGVNVVKNPPVASEGSPALAELQGEVETVDQNSHVLKVRDRMDKTWEVRVDPATQIKDNQSKDLKLSSLHEDDHVHIYYNTRDLSARQIDRIPSPVDQALGLD